MVLLFFVCVCPNRVRCGEKMVACFDVDATSYSPSHTPHDPSRGTQQPSPPPVHAMDGRKFRPLRLMLFETSRTCHDRIPVVTHSHNFNYSYVSNYVTWAMYQDTSCRWVCTVWIQLISIYSLPTSTSLPRDGPLPHQLSSSRLFVCVVACMRVCIFVEGMQTKERARTSHSSFALIQKI